MPEGNTRCPTRIRNKHKHLEGYVFDEEEGEDNVNYTVDYTVKESQTYQHVTRLSTCLRGVSGKRPWKTKITALNNNDTYDLVTPPKYRQIVGGKWVYTMKNGPNGEETHKTKGYSQIAEIDYQETFAPTACMSSVRMLVQLAVEHDMVHGHSPDGCENCLPKRTNRLRYLHGTAKSFRKGRQKPWPVGV